MTKEVLLSISGLHYDVFTGTEEEENEPIEVITPASYYYKNGKHYIIYEEVVEGLPGTIKNKVRISEIWDAGNYKKRHFQSPYDL